MTRNLREHILKTASELFYCQGIKATGIDAIIKATGVAKMSLYKYFPTKNDLIIAHLQHYAGFLSENIIQTINKNTGQPVEQLLDIFDFFENVVKNPEFRGCPFVNATAEFAESGHPVQLATADFFNAFSGILTELVIKTGATNPKVLTDQLSILISGALVKHQVQKSPDAMANAKAAAKVLIAQSLNQQD